MVSRPWDNRLHQIQNLGAGITVWSVALMGYPAPKYKPVRVGEYIGVFRGEELEDAVTSWDNKIDADICRVARGNARRLRQPTRKEATSG